MAPSSLGCQVLLNKSDLRSKWIFMIPLKLTSHDILHYLWSVDLSKSFPQLIVSIFTFLNIFYNRFYPVKKCGVTPHWLYRDSLTLNVSFFSKIFMNTWLGSNNLKNACIRASRSNYIILMILLRYQIFKNFDCFMPVFYQIWNMPNGYFRKL